METKTGFLEESPGNFSTARGGFWLIVLTSILQSTAILTVGCIAYYKDMIGHESLMAVALASGTVLTSGTGVATTLKVMSKSRENTPATTDKTTQP